MPEEGLLGQIKRFCRRRTHTVASRPSRTSLARHRDSQSCRPIRCPRLRTRPKKFCGCSSSSTSARWRSPARSPLIIAVILAIVVFSYRQTIHAYPSGGGAYIVARENLGEMPSLVAASALLIDYILTVAVSIAAGVAALTSAFPQWIDHRVALALAFMVILTLGNLRGIRESGNIFAAPTYFFIVSLLALIAVGAWRATDGRRSAGRRRSSRWRRSASR